MSFGYRKRWSERDKQWDFSLGSSMYDHVSVLATVRGCHLAVARNAVRFHHHHHISAAGVYLICLVVMLSTKDTVQEAGFNIWANVDRNDGGPEVE